MWPSSNYEALHDYLHLDRLQIYPNKILRVYKVPIKYMFKKNDKFVVGNFTYTLAVAVTIFMYIFIHIRIQSFQL